MYHIIIWIPALIGVSIIVWSERNEIKRLIKGLPPEDSGNADICLDDVMELICGEKKIGIDGHQLLDELLQAARDRHLRVWAHVGKRTLAEINPHGVVEIVASDIFAQHEFCAFYSCWTIATEFGRTVYGDFIYCKPRFNRRDIRRFYRRLVKTIKAKASEQPSL